MIIVRDGIWLCVDCMIAAVNGEMPSDSDAMRDAFITEGLEELGPHLVPSFDSETGEGHKEYSAVACHCCTDHHHGERWAFSILGEEPRS